ncbi:putative membrane protein [Paenibacillus phyllosphaerae]|uniref:Putative membrane protein n=1 Tax=Paenibacillus phyllosphaerae TaxID=274593 RepID=A0A7W5B1V8_9BACL|nr:carotenoid biosynthesis protein [Paenibacillus phyllosphaerae]MBB3112893.1 putative membrane protein [Paenibacillus phyllosphaerae]
MLRRLFVFWYACGLALMLTFGVPEWLSFSNGLFLVLFTCYALSIERKLGEPAKVSGVRAGLVALVTFGLESIGVATGYPFGAYQYSTILGLSVAGVPVAIALAWVGIIACAVMVVAVGSKWLRAGLVGGIALILDLVLDPVAYARGFWLWEGDPSLGYYGVPAQNFISWFVIAALASFLYPIRPVPAPVRKEAGRLLQALVLMFGLLGLREGYVMPLAIAACGALLMEGAFIRYAAGPQKRLV